MRIFLPRPASLALLCAGLLTGCASVDPDVVANGEDSSPLPAEVAINPDAGRGNFWMVTLHLADGQELPFVVDTGSSATVLDESLKPILGKPVGKITIQHWGIHEKKATYATPKLYLGGVRLKSGGRTILLDLKGLSQQAGRPILGVLGLDVLENYCLQVDFAASRLRFMDPAQTNKAAWGRAFPLVALNDKDPRPAVAGNLFGAEGPHALIDTGYVTDGWLRPPAYRQWTNQAVAAAVGKARSPDGRFFGEVYPEVFLLSENVESDGIGLRFLARHLVTFDFPGDTLYLERTSAGPLPEIGPSAARSYLKALKEEGRLPGWDKDEHGTAKVMDPKPDGRGVTFEVSKQGDDSVFHYQVAQPSPGGPWRLQKAWRTDNDGHTLEEYPVP